MDDDDPYEGEDSDDSSAIEDTNNHALTAREDFFANPLQRITTANDLFNANPFERISKETDKFLRETNRRKQVKIVQCRPCLDNVTQDDVASCQSFIQRAHDIGRCFDF
jgi:hypothetical protein